VTADSFEVSEENLKKELDRRIEMWRNMEVDPDQRIGAINVLQNLRSTFYGEMKPCGICDKTKIHGHEIEEIKENLRYDPE